MARKNSLDGIKPKETKPKKPKVTQEPTGEDELIQCTACGNKIKRKNFYKSFNPAHVMGITPYCKDCWFRLCANPLGEVDNERFKQLLMMNDKPYIHELFENSFESHKTPQGLVGHYLKRIALQQYRELTWADSIFESEQKKAKKVVHGYDLEELIRKWGQGHSEQELVAFEDKYQFLTNGQTAQNSVIDDATITYVKYRIKADMAIANDNPQDATKWGQLADKAMERAKLAPDKMSKNDLNGGLDNFATLSKEIELATNGVIPILPRYLKQPKDEADFIIYCYISYIRETRNLPPVEYSEIYDFYKRRAEEITYADDEDMNEEEKAYAEE